MKSGGMTNLKRQALPVTCVRTPHHPGLGNEIRGNLETGKRRQTNSQYQKKGLAYTATC